MIKVISIITTTENKYDDLLYDGTIQELNEELRSPTSIMIEFLYKKLDGTLATMFINHGTIECISLAEREVYMEEVKTEDGKTGYQAEKKKSGTEVKFYIPPAVDVQALTAYYSKICKEEVFIDFKEELDAISESAYDRTVNDAIKCTFEVFPPSDNSNIDKAAYFIAAPYVMYIGALLEDQPEIFKDENEAKLTKALMNFAIRNKDFTIENDDQE